MGKTDTAIAPNRNHALALFHAGEYQQAAQALEHLLRAEPTSEIWNDWATAQLMCSRVEESERGYRRALDLDPENNRAAGNLGAILAKSGRLSEAVDFLDRAARTSVGAEREQLLRLIESYRRQLAARSAQPTLTTSVVTELANAIHLQAQAIAALARRVSALEAKTSLLPADRVMPASSSTRSACAEPPCGPRQPKPQTGPKPGVLFSGAIYGGSGYAEETWAAALALADRRIPLQLVPAGEQNDSQNLIPRDARQRLEELARQTVDIPRSIFYQASPAQSWNMNAFGRTRVGRTMYETDSIPESFRGPCNAMDEVWVPSRFNLETFAAGGVCPKKLRYVPGGIDTRIFQPGVEPLNIPKRRGFNFVSVFDWQDRKGYDILLRAYLREFTAADDVALLLKVYQMIDRSSDLAAFITHFIERQTMLTLERAPAIVLINGFLSQQEMVRFYAAGQCFVLPTHGEGYGRPYLEALACELPVIATGWGGQLDFLNSRNSYLIESQLVDVPAGVEVNISAGHRWAQPNEDHLRALMREVYSHPEEARQKAGQGRDDVRRQYDWSVVAPLWVDEFRRLLN